MDQPLEAHYDTGSREEREFRHLAWTVLIAVSVAVVCSLATALWLIQTLPGQLNDQLRQNQIRQCHASRKGQEIVNGNSAALASALRLAAREDPVHAQLWNSLAQGTRPLVIIDCQKVVR